MPFHNIPSCSNTNAFKTSLGRQQQSSCLGHRGEWKTADTAQPVQPLATFSLPVSSTLLEPQIK